MFWAVILVPKLFRKLRETPGNNFHLVSSKSEPGCPSYDQKIKRFLLRFVVNPQTNLKSAFGDPITKFNIFTDFTKISYDFPVAQPLYAFTVFFANLVISRVSLFNVEFPYQPTWIFPA